MENLENAGELNPLSDVLFIVLLYKNENMNVRAPYDIEIMGKKMWEWVALAGDGAKIKTMPCTKDTDVISLIKPFVGNETYTMVFYSDTPLISRQMVIEILDYFKAKDQNALVLKRGMVFKSEYLLNCERVLAGENELFAGLEFESVDNFEKLSKINQTLKDQILKYHMLNGVFFTDLNTTHIDADVVIEKGVRIEANNTIKGQSYIGENCTLEPNNIIKDSIISKNVIVKNSYILNSGIAENMIVGPFESVINQNV